MQAGIDTDGNAPGSTKEPGIGWITGFLFVSSFVGLLALVPLRKVYFFLIEVMCLRTLDVLLTASFTVAQIMIIDYKLTYPSGTATAVLINGFHTPKGDKMAKYAIPHISKTELNGT